MLRIMSQELIYVCQSAEEILPRYPLVIPRKSRKHSSLLFLLLFMLLFPKIFYQSFTHQSFSNFFLVKQADSFFRAQLLIAPAFSPPQQATCSFMVFHSSSMPYVPLHRLFLSCPPLVNVLPSLQSSSTWLSPKREHPMNAHALTVLTADHAFSCNISQGSLHQCRTLSSNSIEGENILFTRGIHLDILNWEARRYTPLFPRPFSQLQNSQQKYA